MGGKGSPPSPWEPVFAGGRPTREPVFAGGRGEERGRMVGSWVPGELLGFLGGSSAPRCRRTAPCTTRYVRSRARMQCAAP